MFKCIAVMMTLGFVVNSLAGTLVWEAEDASSVEAPMVKVEKANPPDGVKAVSGASADCYLEIPEGKGNPPKVTKGKAVYEVDVPSDGVYVLWARAYWDGRCSNSFSVQVGEAKAFSYGQGGTYKSWHWVRSMRRLPQLRLKKGKQTITFSNREDGVRIDQIALSSNRRWVPVGVESLRP